MSCERGRGKEGEPYCMPGLVDGLSELLIYKSNRTLPIAYFDDGFAPDLLFFLFG